MTAVMESEATTAEHLNNAEAAAPRRRAPQPEAQRIVLMGFMGSGKTTVGRLLAAELGWEFADLDHVIEQRTGQTVPELFAKRGEEAFRREETAALAATLRRTHVVLALGGGAPETLSNRLLLEQTPATAVIFLDAPFSILTGRCATQAADPTQTLRPLLADLDAAERRFHDRLPLYRRLARHTLATASESPATATKKLLSLVGITA